MLSFHKKRHPVPPFPWQALTQVLRIPEKLSQYLWEAIAASDNPALKGLVFSLSRVGQIRDSTNACEVERVWRVFSDRLTPTALIHLLEGLLEEGVERKDLIDIEEQILRRTSRTGDWK
jgi:hypothetical protein